jgi:hypothetical protein
MSTNRIGFHYIPDTQHYRQSDLDTWLPELSAMKTRWLVLEAPPDRAIPEAFIRGLLGEQIEPVLQFNLSSHHPTPTEDLALLFNIYAKWGVRYLTFFTRPNLRTFWRTANWVQAELVERFLDIYLPLTDTCLNSGLIPIFPALEPGGDYWDTAFLRASLQGIKRRGKKHLLDKLVIGAIARTGRQNLNWGAGGPERWPDTRPYFSLESKENHQGFRIFDWYDALVQSVLIESKPIFLFEVGCSLQNEGQDDMHTQLNLSIAQLLEGEVVPGLEPIPTFVLGSAFWLLSATQGSPNLSQAWYKPSGERLPIVPELHKWVSGIIEEKKPTPKEFRQIAHYVLLPSYQGEVSDNQLDLIRPMIKKYKPTIGFSIEEARLAKRVTILGGNGSYPDDSINQLRNSGCIVYQVDENGMDIASMLSR